MSTRILIENALGERKLPEGWPVLAAGLVTQGNVEEVIERQAGDNSAKLEYLREQSDEMFANPEIRYLP